MRTSGHMCRAYFSAFVSFSLARGPLSHAGELVEVSPSLCSPLPTESFNLL